MCDEAFDDRIVSRIEFVLMSTNLGTASRPTFWTATTVQSPTTDDLWPSMPQCFQVPLVHTALGPRQARRCLRLSLGLELALVARATNMILRGPPGQIQVLVKEWLSLLPSSPRVLEGCTTPLESSTERYSERCAPAIYHPCAPNASF